MPTVVEKQIDHDRIEDIVKTTMWADLWVSLDCEIDFPSELIGKMCLAAEQAAMAVYVEGQYS